MLVRRAPRRSSFGPIDIVPVAGLATALTLGVVWLVGDDTRLRPCRLGNELACEKIATRLLEAAELAPASSPTPWEEHAARVLDAEHCPGSEPGPCGVRRTRSAASRSAPADSRPPSRRSARPVTSTDAGARAGQEKAVQWTPAEQDRLERRSRP
jgi:hypothetical protein